MLIYTAGNIPLMQGHVSAVRDVEGFLEPGLDVDLMVRGEMFNFLCVWPGIFRITRSE